MTTQPTLHIKIRDYAERTAYERITIPDAADLEVQQGIIDAVANASAGAVVEVTREAWVVEPSEDIGVPAVYGKRGYAMVLEFTTATSVEVRYIFRAPKDACFLPNSEDIDEEEANTANLIAVLMADALAPNGEELDTFVHGYRTNTISEAASLVQSLDVLAHAAWAADWRRKNGYAIKV